MLRNVATALIIIFGVLIMALVFAFALDYFDLLNRECCQTSVIQGIEACPLILEESTATPTVVHCELEVPTGTLVVITASPTVDLTNPPQFTSTPNSTNPPNSTSTSDPTNPPDPSATPDPTATKKPKCNKGGGNDDEGCDPGGNPCKGNDDEPDLCNDI